MLNIKPGDFVTLNHPIRANSPTSAEYEVKEVRSDGGIWILTPDFAQPFGYDGELTWIDFVQSVRHA